MLRRHALSTLILGGASALTGTAPRPAAAQACTVTLAAPDIVAPGKFTIAINPTLPPVQYIDSAGALQGMNVELHREIAKRLCLTPEFVRLDFPAMIPGLSAGRFDVVTSMFWTEERARIMYLVPYLLSAIAIVVPLGTRFRVESTEDLAGRSVAVEADSYQERWIRQFGRDNDAKGLRPTTVRAFPTGSDVIGALRAGQADIGAVTDYSGVELSRRGLVRLDMNGVAPSANVQAYRSRRLAEAAAAAMTAIRADGIYDEIIERLGLTPLPDRVFSIRGTGPT